MQINDHKLIAECSSYDFKEAVERKKTKSWLKTVSAFANGNGGSLYYGIDDEGTVIGLTDAQSDAEYSGNLMMLLRNGVDFIKSFTNKGWKKLPNRRLNTPDYAERATFEGLVNHLIHRDYVVVGSEVHIDIYDDRLALTSPGGMYDGTLIQERDINTVASCRRNPVIADVFAQMDFMEKRGSGLRKICRESAILPNYKEERKPTFRSEGTVFYTVFKNVNYKEESAPESILKTTPITTPISGLKSGTKIIELMAGNPKITATEISVALTLSRDHVKKLIRNLRENGIIQREGTNKGGYWKVLPPYNNPKKTNK